MNQNKEDSEVGKAVGAVDLIKRKYGYSVNNVSMYIIGVTNFFNFKVSVLSLAQKSWKKQYQAIIGGQTTFLYVLY